MRKESGDKNEKRKYNREGNRHRLRTVCRTGRGKKRISDHVHDHVGIHIFSASMWVGQQLAEGLDFYGFIKSLILGGMILGLYTGLLGYVGAKTGLSMDLLAKRAFGEKGSYISSAMISFTQIGWFGVGVAMFAIPVANELLGGSKVAMWGLVIVAGGCMTASAYFGIDSLTLISYIAVPLVAVLGTVAMILAVQRGDGTIIDQFAKSSGTISVIGGAGMVVAAVCYVIGQMVRKNEAGNECIDS